MPVPTETFRNIRKLNVIFLASAALLLLATMWMVMADHGREWHPYQLNKRDWDVAMTKEAAEAAQSAAYKKSLADAQAELNRTLDSLPKDKIDAIHAEQREIQAQIDRLKLPADVEKGKITPTTQKYEQAVIDHSENSPQAQTLLRELTQIKQKSDEFQKQLAESQQLYDAKGRELAELLAAEEQAKKRVTELEREVKTYTDKLAEIAPGRAGRIGEHLRNAPLLDWFNPSLKPEQVIVGDIRENYNFITVETIDRCKTCHINIDNARFTAADQIGFLERQLAQEEGQDVTSVERPVVLLSFWLDAVRNATLDNKLGQINQKAVLFINGLVEEAGEGEEVEADKLAERLKAIQLKEHGNETVSRARWHRAVEYYRDDLQQLLRTHIGKEQYVRLTELYRRELIQRYNAVRSEKGQKALSDSPVLLAHSRLDLFVDADSKHPMKTVGCTSCHDGSGQETQFEHTAHMPREAWVDAETGALVPDFLVGRIGEPKEIADWLKEDEDARKVEGEVQVVTASLPASGPQHRPAGTVLPEGEGADHSDHHHYIHYDVPFAPEVDPHGQTAVYAIPGQGRPRMAVRQADYWSKKYHWHAVHSMHWERPMHPLQYVESNCARCHTEIFDVRDTAPKLFDGRKLFAQLGCANCHAVTDLQDDLDVKRVGPSLVNVKHKLSEPMIATWIWSPKAFRPTSRMPHLFMQENNASPIDIARTRVEVAAMAHFLKAAEPTPAFYQSTGQPAPNYQAVTPPEPAGKVERGRDIFKKVGCMACHTNLTEYGESWITQDLAANGMDESEAAAAYASMSYNQRHWYALEHLSDKLELTGPELSGVGSKLLAGRTEQEAKTWLYDWLRNPRHYSSYTIMPSFRLSEDEANDLAAYLLSLKRPGDTASSEYTPGDFSLDDNGKVILRELVAVLRGARSTLELARADVDKENKSDDELMMELGQQMIRHYGCSGCHLINGMEAETSACTTLDDWGLKDPHKLAFEYFDHAFDDLREKPAEIWKVSHEGLEADAARITPNSDKVHPDKVAWEHMELERRPWLYHKLHNTRVYDRGRSALNGHWDPTQPFDRTKDSVGKPYDKLKMPRFYLKDEEVQALVTYVTSVRRPLVSPQIQKVTDDAGMRVIRGRQLATLYNCYGCHNIEANEVNIQQYFHTRNPDGSYNGDALNWAPPRLIGQGAKTQPDWVHHFLQNVHPIRPWLFVRMPSFPVNDHDASGLADYFAGHAQTLTVQLGEILAAIDQYNVTYVKSNPGSTWKESGWHRAPSLKRQVEALREFALKSDLAAALNVDLNPLQVDLESEEVTEQTPEAQAENWNTVLAGVRALASTYQTQYPYVQQRDTNISLERFMRGERLFAELGCMTGECHRMGDEALLIEKGYFAPAQPFGPNTLESLLPADAVATEETAAEAPADEEEMAEEDEEFEEEEEEFEEDEEVATDTLTPVTPPSGAPNLALTGTRLQPNWTWWWVQHAQKIQPGTRMQEFFRPDETGEPTSFFMAYADDIRREKETIYGYTGREQLDSLLDFLYTAGPRGYTYSPEGERLDGGPRQQVELKPLEPRPTEKADAEAQAVEEETGAEVETPAPVETPEPEVETPVAPPVVEEEEKSALELQEEASVAFAGTRIVGQVTFAGQPRKRKPINMAADKACVVQHPHGALEEGEVINEDGTIRHVFIYVKEGLPEQKWEPPAQSAVLDQHGCVYKPHVLAVMVGQKVLIPNSDPTTHNVNMQSRRNGQFNQSMGPRVKPLERVFEREEIGGTMTFTCQVHGWMKAVGHVVSHPFFAVSDAQGRYEIKGLPPGTYTLEAIHEQKRIKPVTFTVDVKADTSLRQDVQVGG